MEKTIDFVGLAAAILPRAGEFCSEWLPGGHMEGREYCCGDIRGGPGNSFKVNMGTGIWADFASDFKGGDLISLYAAVCDIKNGEAAKLLAAETGFGPPVITAAQVDHVLAPPPPDAYTIGSMSMLRHTRHGEPSKTWAYKDATGKVLFFIARYDNTADGKQYCPWSWSSTAKRWVMKAWPAPRPLYGLERLSERLGAPVMVCEGEKAADAAQMLAGGVYVCVSWPNGSKGVDKADWKPLYGRKVLIWPDGDAKTAETEGQAAKYDIQVGDLVPYDYQPGASAANKIAAILAPKCPEVKVLDVGVDQERVDGWDAADAVSDGWGWPQLLNWAKPRAMVVAVASASVKQGPGAVAVAKTTVNVTVVNGEEEGGSANKWALWEDLGLTMSGKGSPHINVDNALRVLEHHAPIKGMVWFDEFHKKLFTGTPAREWKNVDTLNLTAYMQRMVGLSKVSDEMVYKSCIIYGHKNMRNEPRDWMESLVWDGQDRIISFLSCAFGVDDEKEYIQAASRNFWIGLVARILRPGCKMDNMLVLEGKQGAFKSTALNIIGGSWYAEMRGSVLEKDFFMNLHGKLVIEIAELSAFRRAEFTAIKQVISCQTDRYRAPYDRSSEDHPRQSIFVGTTNEETYLGDDTGGRRFWPIKCNNIDLEYLRTNRDQLFAESVAKFKRGDTWYEMPKGETEQEQEIRRHTDEWESVIRQWLLNKNEVGVVDIAVDCLKIDIGRLDMMSMRRISGILRRLVWVKNVVEEGRKNTWSRIDPIKIEPETFF